MILDKKISLGTIITLVTILGTFIFTQGATTTKIESIESEGRDSRKKIQSNRDRIQNVQVSVARLESKIDEGFKPLEKLLIEN